MGAHGRSREINFIMPMTNSAIMGAHGSSWEIKGGHLHHADDELEAVDAEAVLVARERRGSVIRATVRCMLHRERIIEGRGLIEGRGPIEGMGLVLPR